ASVQLEQVVVEVVEVRRLPFALGPKARLPDLCTNRLKASLVHSQLRFRHPERDMLVRPLCSQVTAERIGMRKAERNPRRQPLNRSRTPPLRRCPPQRAAPPRPPALATDRAAASGRVRR